jgi:hypothetical protein
MRETFSPPPWRMASSTVRSGWIPTSESAWIAMSRDEVSEIRVEIAAANVVAAMR